MSIINCVTGNLKNCSRRLTGLSDSKKDKSLKPSSMRSKTHNCNNTFKLVNN